MTTQDFYNGLLFHSYFENWYIEIKERNFSQLNITFTIDEFKYNQFLETKLSLEAQEYYLKFWIWMKNMKHLLPIKNLNLKVWNERKAYEHSRLDISFHFQLLMKKQCIFCHDLPKENKYNSVLFWIDRWFR